MSIKLALDFGTTNTVIAHWDEAAEQAELISLAELACPDPLPIIPSLLYVQDGASGRNSTACEVLVGKLNHRRDNRLFRNFKRGVVTLPTPAPRLIDNVAWGDREAAEAYLKRIFAALPFPTSDIEELVITVPVVAFDHYLEWLRSALGEYGISKIRLVDESTAAALGYAVQTPGEPVLVFDFGGGTLDLTLIELPKQREKTGGLLETLRRGDTQQYTARVLAKAGRILGGSDIDQWLLMEVLKRLDIRHEELDDGYAPLLSVCESAKIALTESESVTLNVDLGHETRPITLHRSDLEAILEQNGFFVSIRHLVDKVMHTAGREGIFKEDIHHVLAVGGTSLMPSVRRALNQYFRQATLHTEKPFTAIVEGALQVTAGYGLDDYLINSYGLRYLDQNTGQHAYDEIIPQGTPVPTKAIYEVLMSASQDGQTELEFVIGLIDTESPAMLEVHYENGQTVFVARPDQNQTRVVALNEFAPPIIVPLNPPGIADEERLRAAFHVDAERRLRVTVTDLKTRRELLKDQIVVTLR